MINFHTQKPLIASETNPNPIPSVKPSEIPQFGDIQSSEKDFLSLPPRYYVLNLTILKVTKKPLCTSRNNYPSIVTHRPMDSYRSDPSKW